MGGWEIYCAICGSTFSSQVDMDPEGTDEEYYRYEVLKDCNLEWLDKVCALGINPDVSGNDKFVTVAPYQTMNKAFSLTFRSFVTGVGHYWDCVRLL